MLQTSSSIAAPLLKLGNGYAHIIVLPDYHWILIIGIGGASASPTRKTFEIFACIARGLESCPALMASYPDGLSCDSDDQNKSPRSGIAWPYGVKAHRKPPTRKAQHIHD